MPAYKWIGNRVLTRVENSLLGSRLSEFHSGYRAYNVEALADLPFKNNTNGFDFDTQIIVQLLDRGKRIVEVPIPTYYGDEICYVNGMRYARDVVRDVMQYRLNRMGFGTHTWIPASSEYEFKEGEGTSHTVLLDMLSDTPPKCILDLGCSGGRLAERLRKLGHHVTGVDGIEVDGVRDRVDEFVLGNLEDGVPAAVGTGFDVVIAADVIEHVTDPLRLLRQMADVVTGTGEILISAPNFGHWYPRLRVASGMFDYDRRGILDETHLRFFSRSSLLRTVRASGIEVLEVRYHGSAVRRAVERPGTVGSRVARRIDRLLVKVAADTVRLPVRTSDEAPPRRIGN